MQQLEANLNFISTLPDQPAMSTAELKQEFDKAGNTIKDYINNTHLPELTQFQQEVENTIASEIASAKSEIRGEMNTLRTELEGEMEELNNRVTEALEGGLTVKTSYEDFVTEEKSANYSLTQSSNAPLTFTYTKEGYFPLAISSVRLSTWYEVDTMTPAYFETQAEGRAVVKMLVAHGNTAASISGTAYVKVLWVKIRRESN